MKSDVHICTAYASFPLVVPVNWTVSQSIEVNEGEGVEVRLSGNVFGIYAYPVTIDVICSESVANVGTGIYRARNGQYAFQAPILACSYNKED